MNRRLAAIVIVGVVWGLATHPSAAQGQAASLDGRVTDEQDGALVGVMVAARTGRLPQSIVVITDATGHYQFPDLPDGIYTLTFSLSGFETQRHEGVVLQSGTARVLSVRLFLAPLSQRVDVIAVAPLLGAGVSRERVPTTVTVLDADDLERRRAASLADALNGQLGAVTLTDTTTNIFQPTLRFRGFTASPLLGLPQGVAVYQNGIRINEPFGDTVQFDLIPQFALQRVQLSAGVDPTFGLNALGGTLALQLKNGFEADGFRGEFSGGSFDRITGTAEVGTSSGPWAIYLGGTRFDETGWRVASESEVTQSVADLAYRANRIDAGVSLIYADTTLNGNGPAPVELLAADRGAVFTFPDTTENRLGLGQARFNFVVSPTWSLQVNGYYRDLDRQTLNGDEADFEVCEPSALPHGAPSNTLCHGSGDDGAGEAEAAVLVDVPSGKFITADDARGDGAFNRTTTAAASYGATAQVSSANQISHLDNMLIIGASLDLASVAFASNGEVGTLTPERSVAGSGLFMGVFDQAPDDEFNTALDTETRNYGFYFSDTLSLTDRFHVTVSGRYNEAWVDIADRLGTALDGRHFFSRFNPAVGAVYAASDGVSLFGRYSESNRTPTAAELSCADPSEPCRVPNAFVSDPPLEQPVARSIETGVRGRITTGPLTGIEWSTAGYATRIRDDILFVASSELIGTGFFQNAGGTARVGLDLDLTGRAGQLDWYASYGLIEATFDSALVLPSNPEVNDAATDNGELHVERGDRLPNIPRHSFKGGVRSDLTDAWELVVEALVTSSQVFRGDEGNDQSELAGYGIVNLRSVYQVDDRFELFLTVHNLLGRDYETFGILAELELELDEAPGAEDPRFISAGAPQSVFAGFRVRF